VRAGSTSLRTDIGAHESSANLDAAIRHDHVDAATSARTEHRPASARNANQTREWTPGSGCRSSAMVRQTDRMSRAAALNAQGR
jgi:hypothetical protein